MKRLGAILAITALAMLPVLLALLVQAAHAQTNPPDWRSAFTDPDAVFRVYDQDTERALQTTARAFAYLKQNPATTLPALFARLESELLRASRETYAPIPDRIKTKRDALVAQYGEGSTQVQTFDQAVQDFATRLNDLTAVKTRPGAME